MWVKPSVTSEFIFFNLIDVETLDYPLCPDTYESALLYRIKGGNSFSVQEVL